MDGCGSRLALVGGRIDWFEIEVGSPVRRDGIEAVGVVEHQIADGRVRMSVRQQALAHLDER